MHVTSSFTHRNEDTFRQYVGVGDFRAVEKNSKTAIDIDKVSDIEPTSTQSLKRRFEPPSLIPWAPTGTDSIPLQIWEGTVIQLDDVAGSMHVMLNAKIGQVPRHTADINLEWVTDQDKDLIRPGAIFYLTLFKRTKRGSIENSQELRFRRRPSWSESQLKRIDKDSSKLLIKMKELPQAE